MSAGAASENEGHSSRMKRFVMIVGLVLFGLGLGLGVFEVALRVTGLGGPAELDPTYDRSALRFSPDVGRRNPWARNEDDVLTVAVIGDSFTNNFSNQWYDGYVQRLEHLLNLNEGARPAKVGAFAKNGTTTFQQLELLDWALDWEADLIILGIFLNDTEVPGDEEFAARFTSSPTGWRLQALTSSRALAWLYLRYESARNNLSLDEQLEYLFAPDYEGFKKFKRAIRTFARKTRAREVGLVAVIWPNMFALGPDYPLEMPHERIAQVLSDAGVPYLDLLDEFRNTSPVRMATYPGVDSHPSEIAHRVAATALFTFLLDGGHVDGSYRPRKEKHPMGEPYWLGRVRYRRNRFAPPKKD